MCMGYEITPFCKYECTHTHTHTHTNMHKHTSKHCICLDCSELIEKIQSKTSSGSGGGVPTADGENVRQRRQEEQMNNSRNDHPQSDACAPAYTPQQQQSVDR